MGNVSHKISGENDGDAIILSTVTLDQIASRNITAEKRKPFDDDVEGFLLFKIIFRNSIQQIQIRQVHSDNL